MNPTTNQPEAAPPIGSPPIAALPVSSIIRALVILVIVAIVGVILAAVLLPNNTTLVLQILGVIVPTTGALLAYLQSTYNQAKIQAIHVDVNSRLTELLRTQGESEHAKGVLQGSEVLSIKQSTETTAAALEAANVAKQAAETAKEAALAVTNAAAQAASVLAATQLPPPIV